MQVAVVRGGKRTVAFAADLVPTTTHLDYPYIMGFDMEPLATLASKRRFLSEALAENWWIVFEHDREVPLARLDHEDGKILAQPVEGD
jgi:glyoxylase-like metal-dependent hydrolase (beta-lactamase superfamily II)